MALAIEGISQLRQLCKVKQKINLESTSLGTKSIPEISNYGLHCQKCYLVLMLDLDVQIPGTGIQCVVLHWSQPDLIFDCNAIDSPFLLEPDPVHIPVISAPYLHPKLHLSLITVTLFFFSTSHLLISSSNASNIFLRKQWSLEVVFMQAALLDPHVAINYFFGRPNASKGGEVASECDHPIFSIFNL
ncbi:hypothetical protein N7526_010969 [Penicillium atrosanguineum]|nr:hypothetical protein N7526_010969 [Penicillium atrosanguineum]